MVSALRKDALDRILKAYLTFPVLAAKVGPDIYIYMSTIT